VGSACKTRQLQLDEPVSFVPQPCRAHSKLRTFRTSRDQNTQTRWFSTTRLAECPLHYPLHDIQKEEEKARRNYRPQLVFIRVLCLPSLRPECSEGNTVIPIYFLERITREIPSPRSWEDSCNSYKQQKRTPP
jgi:hypothetical protein